MSTSHDSGTRPSGNASETVDELKGELSEVSQAGSEAAREVAESRYEQGRDVTSEQLDTASEAIKEAADKLEENNSPFASYASELSVQLSSFSDKLSTSSMDDLVSGARTLARENPAAFMLGSMAIGLAASRFFKATGEEVSQQTNSSSAYSSGTGRSDYRTGMGYDDHGTHNSNSTISSHGTMDRQDASTAAGIHDSTSIDRSAIDQQDAYSAPDMHGTSDSSVADQNISSHTDDDKPASDYTNRTTSKEV